MIISRLAELCLGELRTTGGVFDALRMDGPLLPLDPLWVAMACSIAMLAFLGREWYRQRSERLSLVEGPPRSRPDYSPAALRYLKTLDVDATTVVTALIGLASKGSISLRMVGDGIDLARVEGATDEGLTKDEEVVLEHLIAERTYIDLTNLWSDSCGKVVHELKVLFVKRFGGEFYQRNVPFLRRVKLGMAGFLVVLSLTTPNPVESIFMNSIILFALGFVIWIIRHGIHGNASSVASPPSLIGLVRRPSMGKVRGWIGYFRSAGTTVKQAMGLFFFLLFMLFFTLVVTASIFNFPAAILFLAVLAVGWRAHHRLGDRLTLRGAQVVAEVECYTRTQRADVGEDPGLIWADALALGALDDVDSITELQSSHAMAGLKKHAVPAWFTRSGGDATLDEFLVVLSQRLPDGIEAAIAKSRRGRE